MKIKSVQSIHLCKSVIQTICDIVKAQSGELKVETKDGEGSEFYYSIASIIFLSY
jgi:hypothetical protein